MSAAEKPLRLSQKGRLFYPDTDWNPHHLTAKRISPPDDLGEATIANWPHWVEWSNGGVNAYRDGELEEVDA